MVRSSFRSREASDGSSAPQPGECASPFFHSRPSRPLLATTLACAAIGVVLPFSPLAGVLGFTALPAGFLAILVLMVVTYLGLVEAGKSRFFRPEPGERPLARRRGRWERRIHRVAARWSHPRLRVTGTT